MRRRDALALPWLLAMNGAPAAAAPAAADGDPYLWLEDVDGERAIAWVRERNAQSRHALEAWPRFTRTRQRLLEILDSRDRIPEVTRHGAWLYNHWQDRANPRGLWRRTTLDEYRKAKPTWQTLLDIDALGQAEDVNWLFHGAQFSGPHDARCLVQLSRGGADASVVREFDLATRRFVEDGFRVAEAKTEVAWIDEDTIYVATDFGPGSLTDSGYPRTVRRWKRGTPLADAQPVFEARQDDVGVGVAVDGTPGFEMTHLVRHVDFYRHEHWLIDAHTGPLPVRVPKPDDARVSFWYGLALVELRSDWTQGERTWPRGSLLATDAAALREGRPEFTALFTPSASRSLDSFVTTRGTVVLAILDDVAARVQEWQPTRSGGSAPRWNSRDVDAPFPGSIGLQSWHDSELAEDPLAEAYALSYTDFLTPDTLALAHTGRDAREPLKARPSFFDSTGMKVEQRFAKSPDGTRVPYFVVWPRGARADGRNPTLLYGYGGFQVSLQPWYSAAFGHAWYAQGGVLAVANIRGGGEYGPAWHQAAIKAHKQRSFDDFAAVAEDLVRTHVTNAAQLGMLGGSNGGLLVGAVMLQRPELFGAAICEVPLLDMRRYHKLLAGASWMAEYGDPDKPEDWAVIARYSPYQNVRRDQRLPPVLFITSTRDDRVHPGHARKMAARMIEQGHRVHYYENIEGGHGAAADNAQRADMLALQFAFAWQRLDGRKKRLPTPSRESSR